MECCDVEMQVTASRTEERDGAVVDILTYKCPICGREIEKEYPQAQ